MNSQELFVVTHRWKNEMQKFYILRDNSGNHYWLNLYQMLHNSHPFVLVILTVTLYIGTNSIKEVLLLSTFIDQKVKLRANNKIAWDYIGSK